MEVISRHYTLWPASFYGLCIHWAVRILAPAIAVVIVGATLLLWPISHLGFEVDLETQTIRHVIPGSSADEAGLRIGDRLVSIYGVPFDDIFRNLNRISLLGPRDRPIAVTVARSGEPINLNLRQDVPDLGFQLSKLAMLSLAALCWLTGYILGVVRRHSVPGADLVAVFWLGLSGVIGTIPFATYAAVPLLLALDWLVISVFAPLLVAVHLQYPPRIPPPRHTARARAVLVGASVVINVVAIIWWGATRPSMLTALQVQVILLPLALVISLVGSAVIMVRSYRQAVSLHQRRQIRLIATACIVAGLSIVLLVVVPGLFGMDWRSGRRAIPFLCGLVPLSYLMSGVVTDLYRLDRLVVRLTLHLATLALLVTLLELVSRILALHGTSTVGWMALALVSAYRPACQVLSHVLPKGLRSDLDQEELERAERALSQTLDAPKQVAILMRGIRKAFGEPALACFLHDAREPDRLLL